MPIELNLPLLTVRAIKAVPVMVPLNFVMGTSQQALREVPLLLIDVETEEGVTGRSYLFGYVRAALPAIAAILGEVEAQTSGKKADPQALFAQLNKRFTLMGVQGVVRMAIAGFDVALWDAVAIAAGKPLAAMLGGEMKPLLAYNSCGLGLKDDLGALAAEAETLVAMGGFGAVKLRLGYPTLDGDIAAVRAVKKRIGDKVRLMVDYNQALSFDQALARGRALDAEGLYWLEEPVRHDDYAGEAKLARELNVPIQIGENFSLPANMRFAIEQGAADYVMPDLERIGGVSGWLEAAAIAAETNIPMSSHLFPEVSAHLLAVTPTRHYLEYADWAALLLQEPLRIENGHAIIPQRPGNGMLWDDKAVARYRLD